MGGIINQITWIPDKFAVQGRHVKLKKEDGGWDDGWYVNTVYNGFSFDESYINERSQDYKKQRKSSDV